MSLPAYLFLYDANGRLISGSSDGIFSELLECRQGAIEVMNSSHKNVREYGCFNWYFNRLPAAWRVYDI